jgi:geranylgeranyl transferase type-1 subunit beta
MCASRFARLPFALSSAPLTASTRQQPWPFSCRAKYVDDGLVEALTAGGRQRYDGAFAAERDNEGHGGATFCAVAALRLFGALDNALSVEDKVCALDRCQTRCSALMQATGGAMHAQRRLVQWCVMRQRDGFTGRPNKLEDTCYAFWVVSTLRVRAAKRIEDAEPASHGRAQMLGAGELVNSERSQSFLWQTQQPLTGGFGKEQGCRADPMHSYLGLCGCAFNGVPAVARVEGVLNVSERAAAHLRRIQEAHGWDVYDAAAQR